jgi:flagellar biosynthesis protein FlhG
MKNQASGLLEINQQWLGQFTKLKTMAISSGKGGVGKTNVVVNLGVALCEKKLRVAILDADYGLGNIDILLGLEPKHDIYELLSERVKLEDILIQREGLHIIPATSGIQALSQLSPQQDAILFRELRKLESMVDLLIIDTAAGISDNVISLLLAADEIALVVSPEPTSIIDSYAVVKVVTELDIFKKFSVIANQVENEAEANEIFMKISRATQKFLNKSLEYLGYIRYDKNLTEAVKAQRPLIEHYPESAASRDFKNLARTLQNRLYASAAEAGSARAAKTQP